MPSIRRLDPERWLRALTGGGASGARPTEAGARRVDALLALLCGVLATLALAGTHKLGLLPDFWLSLLVSWIAAAALLLRRSAPWLTLTIALASTVSSDDRTPLFFACYAMAAYGGRLRWTGVIAASLGYVITRDLLFPHGYADRPPAYFVTSTLLIPALYGETVRRNRATTAVLRAHACRAGAAVSQAADLAAVEQRTRLAQRTHDLLGHRLTALSMQAAALRLSPAADPALREGAEAVEESARGALAEMRSLLDMLRDPTGRDGVDGHFDFARFVTGLARNMRATGMRISPDVAPNLGRIPAEEGRLLLRVAREALTNAAKYAPGAVVALRLRAINARWRLEVENGPPRGPRIVVDSGGLGLAALHADLSAAGGSLAADATAHGGFLVVAELPQAGQPATEARQQILT
ncbi:signal transduction histidine kinase [Streptacidiphilus sp. MAP12-20]|uniref:sensor histidine kinase n=1 Tax=Streptacidiphilus sp. MAP12-20 TaxID=3156299 RepID=UPI003510E047